MKREYIIAAACVVRTNECLIPAVQNRNIVIGMTHTVIIQASKYLTRRIYTMEDTKGFLTSELRFVNRWEAMKVAKAAGQVVGEQYALFSDNIDLEPYYNLFKTENPEKARMLSEIEIH